MVAFEVPQVAANDSGWGPTTVPEQLDGVPYAPFGKGDRVGRVSDFTAAGQRYGEHVDAIASLAQCRRNHSHAAHDCLLTSAR